MRSRFTRSLTLLSRGRPLLKQPLASMSSNKRMMQSLASTKTSKSNHHLANHCFQLQKKIEDAKKLASLYDNRIDEDGYSLRQKEFYQEMQLKYEIELNQTTHQFQRLLKTDKYVDKTVNDEIELIKEMNQLRQQKEKSTDFVEQFSLNAEINAIKKILNPNFNKLVIGNRSWIAERIVQVAKKLELDIYILHIEDDAKTPAVGQVLEENRLLISAYNNQSQIKEHLRRLVLQYGKIAFHPGIGYLAENPDFADWCAANNIIFIGTPLRQFANKALAKTLAEELKVPIPASYHGDNQDKEFLRSKASEIGYPVMIKVSEGGGGGKLNRLLNSAAEFDNVYSALAKEGSLTIEKFIKNARHIEFNIFGCADTNEVVTVDARDCSKQQRSQKGLEKRLVNMDIAKPLEYVARLNKKAQELGYRASGTFEFLVDDDKNWYFMEMNARTQAEHPVTYYGMNVDVLEWGIRTYVGRSSSIYLQQQLSDEKQYSIQEKLNLKRAQTQSKYVRKIRILAVDVLKNIPKPGEVFYGGLRGTVTDVQTPEIKGKGVVMLSLKPGTKLNIILHAQDPQIGYVIGEGATQIEADMNAVLLASKTHFCVDGQKKDQHLKHACQTLLWIHESGGLELTTTWEKFNKEVYIPRNLDMSFDEILNRFRRISLVSLDRELTHDTGPRVF